MQQQPSAFVSHAQLRAHVGRSVVVAGTVAVADAAAVVLRAHAGASITVVRAQPPPAPVHVGDVLLVRGTVNADLSVAESAAFPPTRVGPDFDLALFDQAAAVTAHINYAAMFA